MALTLGLLCSRECSPVGRQPCGHADKGATGSPRGLRVLSTSGLERIRPCLSYSHGFWCFACLDLLLNLPSEFQRLLDARERLWSSSSPDHYDRTVPEHPSKKSFIHFYALYFGQQ